MLSMRQKEAPMPRLPIAIRPVPAGSDSGSPGAGEAKEPTTKLQAYGEKSIQCYG